MIAVAAAAVIVIAALVILTVFLYDKRTDRSGQIEESQTVQGEKSPPEEPDPGQSDTAQAEAVDPAGSEPPQGWYGMFESSGPMDRRPDISTYREKCSDVYAWIEVPGTDIDYPIAYCEDSDEPFYFTHDINGSPSDKGMIITDSLNEADFSDPMTLVFGQNPDDGTMFAQLHNFRDAGFFNEHDTVSIYMDDAQLVYRIYACYIDADDHIFLSYDFYDPEGFADYFDHIGELRDLSMNIRQDAKPEFGDHVIALITHCDDESKRLFVVATLEEVRY